MPRRFDIYVYMFEALQINVSFMRCTCHGHAPMRRRERTRETERKMEILKIGPRHTYVFRWAKLLREQGFTCL